MNKCIIVDDEPHAIEGLKRYISGIPDLEILNTFTEPVNALYEITTGSAVDLIFLDVDMPGLSGLEIARAVRQKTTKLIITTAHAKYGYDAYEADVDAYLLKPYSLIKFTKTYHKLFPKAPVNRVEKDKADFLFIKSKGDNLKLIKIRIRDIVAVESRLNYIQVHTVNSNVTTYMSLTEFSKILMTFEGFRQFQRSFIIAEDYIEYIEGNTIVMTNGIRISVGDFYRKNFHEFIRTKLIRTNRRV